MKALEAILLNPSYVLGLFVTMALGVFAHSWLAAGILTTPYEVVSSLLVTSSMFGFPGFRFAGCVIGAPTFAGPALLVAAVPPPSSPSSLVDLSGGTSSICGPGGATSPSPWWTWSRRSMGHLAYVEDLVVPVTAAFALEHRDAR